MQPKTTEKPARTPRKNRGPKPQKFYKGRPVFTEEDAAHPDFAFPFPPEPEWEAEWKRRKAQKSK